jgi:hypothetical protein
MAEKTEKYSSLYKAFSGLALLGLLAFTSIMIIYGIIRSLVTGITIFETIRGDVIILIGLPAYFILAVIGKMLDRAREKLVVPPPPPPPPKPLDAPETGLLPRFARYDNLSAKASPPIDVQMQIVHHQLRRVAQCTKAKGLAEARTVLLEKMFATVELFMSSTFTKPTGEMATLIFDLCHQMVKLPLDAVNSYKHWRANCTMMLKLSHLSSSEQERLHMIATAISFMDPDYTVFWDLEMLMVEKVISGKQQEMLCVWKSLVELKAKAKDNIWALQQLVDLRKQLLVWRLSRDVRSVWIPVGNLAKDYLDIKGKISSSDIELLKNLFHVVFFSYPTQAEMSLLEEDDSVPPIPKKPRHKISPHPSDIRREDNNNGKKGRRRGNRRNQG